MRRCPKLACVSISQDPRRWVEEALERLADAGYRRGGARRELLVTLAAQPCALSIAEIEAALAGGERAVSRASVYRILEEFEEIAVVQRLEIDGVTRFEPVGPGRGHHHHLLCDGCGRLEPFSDEGLERAIRRLSGRVPLEVTEHEVVLRGACTSCAADG